MKGTLRETMRHRSPTGYSLLEVLIAMAVFSFGILGFIHLQGHVNRANLDARMRTMAANIAEERIEMQERFTHLASDPDSGTFAYEDITSGTRFITRGGIEFTVTQTVTDYYWDPDTYTHLPETSSGSVFSDFKHVQVNVAWDGNQFNRGDSTGTTVGLLGSGQLNVSTVISARVTATSHLALLDDLAIQGLCIPMVTCM